MTIAEFDNTQFNSSQMVCYKKEIYKLHGVDYDEKLIGFKQPFKTNKGIKTKLSWKRCENIEICPF